MTKAAQSAKFVKSLKDNVAMHRATEEDLKSDLAAVTTDGDRLGQILNSTFADLIDERKTFPASDADSRSIVKDFCATFETFLRS